MTGKPNQSDSTVRRALRRAWEADGRPPCRLCCTAIAEGEIFYVSLVWNSVVHRLCSCVIGISEVEAAQCGKPDQGPRDLCRRPRFCPCPRSSPVNAIVAARRMGLPTIEVATSASPGCERAAREAGLGTHYKNAPLRESLRFGGMMHHGTVVDESLLNVPSSWYEPPVRLLIDVNESVRQGRIVAWRPQSEEP